MEKVEKVHFIVAIVLSDTIMYQNVTLMEFKRSRSYGDLIQRPPGSCLSTFSKGFSSEITRPCLFR